MSRKKESKRKQGKKSLLHGISTKAKEIYLKKSSESAKKHLSLGEMPDQLLAKIILLFTLAAAIVLASIILAIVFSDYKYAALSILSVYLIFLALTIIFDFRKGKIKGAEFVLINAERKFSLQGKKKCTYRLQLENIDENAAESDKRKTAYIVCEYLEFLPGANYYIYWREHGTNMEILCWEQRTVA